MSESLLGNKKTLKSKKTSTFGKYEESFSRKISRDLPETGSGSSSVGHEADGEEVAGRLGDGRRLVPAGPDDQRGVGLVPVVKLGKGKKLK